MNFVFFYCLVLVATTTKMEDKMAMDLLAQLLNGRTFWNLFPFNYLSKANNVATPPTLGEFMLSVETKPEDKVFDYIFKK